MTVKERLIAALSQALAAASAAGAVVSNDPVEIELQLTPNPELGDFSSDLPLRLARLSRQSPAEVAEALRERLVAGDAWVERVDVARSGHLNLHLRAGWLQEVIQQARGERGEFGRSQALGAGSRVQVEFVSADPTGPLTISHGRGAALGDTVARLLEWTGHNVSREFYVNDAGSQLERFARTLDAAVTTQRVRSLVPGDEEFLAELATGIRNELGARLAELSPVERLAEVGRMGRDAVVAHQQRTLQAFGVCFDRWFSEADLHASGKLTAAFERLRTSGQAYDSEGALWLRTSEFGDVEDRPIIRSNGRSTYIAGDLAYHLDKFARGFDHVIDVWGPDHAGYVRRTLAGVQALGGDPGALEILIFQPVLLKIDGMAVEGPGPSGNIATLEEVLEKVGPDAARLHYLARPATSPLEFDLDLAREDSPSNPAAALLSARDAAIDLASSPEVRSALPALNASLAELTDRAARTLQRKLVEFPDALLAAARSREPFGLLRHLTEVAAAFETCRSAELFASSAPTVEIAALVDASAVVLRNGLQVLGVAIPALGDAS